MITANELRIGNYVYLKWSNEYRKTNILDIKDIAENKDYIQEQVEPIPLTPDLLLKSGFTKGELLPSGHTIFANNQYSSFAVCQTPGGYFLTDYVYDVKIYSLHHLQNLYYCLIGQELQITL
jgi:hypothetical protein